MIIHYTLCGTRYPATWTQPQKDTIRCEWYNKVYECDFSAIGIEYEIPDEVKDVIHKAWRETEDGPLHLLVPSLGELSENITIDHGENIELGWENQ